MLANLDVLGSNIGTVAGRKLVEHVIRLRLCYLTHFSHAELDQFGF